MSSHVWCASMMEGLSSGTNSFKLALSQGTPNGHVSTIQCQERKKTRKVLYGQGRRLCSLLLYAWIRKRHKSIPPDIRPRYNLVSDSDHCVKLFATRSSNPRPISVSLPGSMSYWTKSNGTMTSPSPERRRTLQRIIPLPEVMRRRTCSPPKAGRPVAWRP